MSNFINDLTDLAYPKANLRPLPANADPTRWIKYTDWNTLCQAVVDLRGGLLAGTLLGFTEQSEAPSITGADTFLWAKDDGTLVFTRLGVDHDVYSAGSDSSFFQTWTDSDSVSYQRPTVKFGSEFALADHGDGDYVGFNLADTGPGAGTLGGGTSFINSLTLDAKGRITAATVAAPSNPEILGYSLVDLANSNGGTNGSGDTTVGVTFRTNKACHISGARFYWNGPNKTIRVRLYRNGTSVASVDVNTTGTGVYTATFASPYAIVSADAYVAKFAISMYETTGAKYQNATLGNAVLPGATLSGTTFSNNGGTNVQWSPTIWVSGFNWFIAGDNAPTSGGQGTNNEYYPIEPTYTVP